MKSSTNVKAIDVVKQMVADGQVSQEVAEKYFPELKESEDEKIRKGMLAAFKRADKEFWSDADLPIKSIIAWLEKQGEQMSAWSEEDEKKISDILAILRGGENCYYNSPTLIDWLKSLKYRYTWKPTEEQMYNLSEAAHYNCAFFDMEILKGLYDDLKQL